MYDIFASRYSQQYLSYICICEGTSDYSVYTVFLFISDIIHTNYNTKVCFTGN